MDSDKGPPHCAGEIEREIKYFVIGTKDSGSAGVAGVGGSAYYDFEIGESFFKPFDKGSGCVDLAEAYGVEPNTFFQGGVFAGYFAEAIGPAGSVSSVSDHSIQNEGGYCQSYQQIYAIDDEFHFTLSKKADRRLRSSK